MDDCFQTVAPILNGLRCDPVARPMYELMSDALIWTDELPAVSDRERLNLDVTCLRGIFRFRTTLILGIPDEKYRPSWEQAQMLCANWPGLLPDRQIPDLERLKIFEEGRNKLLKAWDDLDEKYRYQQAKQAGAIV